MSDNPGNIDDYNVTQEPHIKAHFGRIACDIHVRGGPDGVEGSGSGFAPEDEPLAISSSVISVVRK